MQFGHFVHVWFKVKESFGRHKELFMGVWEWQNVDVGWYLKKLTHNWQVPRGSAGQISAGLKTSACPSASRVELRSHGPIVLRGQVNRGSSGDRPHWPVPIEWSNTRQMWREARTLKPRFLLFYELDDRQYVHVENHRANAWIRFNYKFCKWKHSLYRQARQQKILSVQIRFLTRTYPLSYSCTQKKKVQTEGFRFEQERAMRTKSVPVKMVCSCVSVFVPQVLCMKIALQSILRLKSKTHTQFRRCWRTDFVFSGPRLKGSIARFSLLLKFCNLLRLGPFAQSSGSTTCGASNMEWRIPKLKLDGVFLCVGHWNAVRWRLRLMGEWR